MTEQTRLFLILEENGSRLQELLDCETSIEDAITIAKEALEDAPTTYIYRAIQTQDWGLQPATHLDYVAKWTLTT
jgi:hypothetical protein